MISSRTSCTKFLNCSAVCLLAQLTLVGLAVAQGPPPPPPPPEATSGELVGVSQYVNSAPTIFFEQCGDNLKVNAAATCSVAQNADLSEYTFYLKIEIINASSQQVVATAIASDILVRGESDDMGCFVLYNVPDPHPQIYNVRVTLLSDELGERVLDTTMRYFEED